MDAVIALLPRCVSNRWTCYCYRHWQSAVIARTYDRVSIHSMYSSCNGKWRRQRGWTGARRGRMHSGAWNNRVVRASPLNMIHITVSIYLYLSQQTFRYSCLIYDLGRIGAWVGRRNSDDWITVTAFCTRSVLHRRTGQFFLGGGRLSHLCPKNLSTVPEKTAMLTCKITLPDSPHPVIISKNPGFRALYLTIDGMNCFFFRLINTKKLFFILTASFCPKT